MAQIWYIKTIIFSQKQRHTHPVLHHTVNISSESSNGLYINQPAQTTTPTIFMLHFVLFSLPAFSIIFIAQLTVIHKQHCERKSYAQNPAHIQSKYLAKHNFSIRIITALLFSTLQQNDSSIFNTSTFQPCTKSCAVCRV